MVCPICKEVKWNRKDWFNPQWQACSPIVDHSSGNYDRCKYCYYNTTSLVPTAANNGVDTKYDKYARWKPLEEFMLHWTSKNMHTSCFKDGVTPGSASASTDPTGSGHGERWTFDPQNVVYALAVQLRTEDMYKRWVGKLNTKEYADELVVRAVALELPVRLVVIPFTPQSSDRPWVITSYEAPGMGLDGTSTVYFGNNDVHYVYLSRGHGIGSLD